ncbi:regulator of G protein signaling superfamily protein [Pseudohyphozyma bogoriensis]|nr:regulator of G protein signaling superfamily protein [Pseudohyphozyma bogoriensis]
MSSDAGLVPVALPQKQKSTRLRKPIPAPAGLRPKKSRYQLPVWNLIYVPKRLLIPPKNSVGSVRSFSNTPLADVKLADVLNNKHLSPLSLKDFEGYLVYKEYSAENLYFILWLNEYTKEWTAWQNDTSAAKAAPAYSQNTDPNAPRDASHLPDYLNESLQRGLAVFFAPNGPLELNLSADARAKTLVEAGNSGNPADFAEARDVIEHSLNRSLAQHTKTCVANAGPVRLVFCFCLGLTIWLASLIPAFVGIFGHHARAWRAIGLPFNLFGAAVMVMALKRICGVIWLLGEDRQLLPWELASPTVTSSSLVSLNCPSTPSSQSSWDEESSIGDKEDSFRSQNSSDPYPWEKEEAVYFGDQAHAMSTVTFDTGSVAHSSRPPSYSKSTPHDLVAESAPMFGPITKVYSSDVARAQYALVVQSLLWGTFVMVVTGSVLMAVPNQ